MAATIARFGRVDVLYANAGVPSAGQVHETSLAEWRRVLDVNLTGVFLSARAVLGGMLARGSGSILLQASVGGITGVRGIAAYAASKGGVAALAQQMAADYSEHGIRVNAICPATILTPLVEAVYRERAGSDEAAAADLARARAGLPARPHGRARGRRQPRARSWPPTRPSGSPARSIPSTAARPPSRSGARAPERRLGRHARP